jgi:hypothetical protein
MPDCDINTHQCVTEYYLCDGTDHCEISAPDAVGKAFRSRCPMGIYVRYAPIKVI